MKRRGILIMAAALTACLGTGLWLSASNAEEAPRRIAAPGLDTRSTAGSETAVLAGGCFWGVQGVFQHVKGVTSAVSGYAGGTADTATYETVSTGSTGHAEAVRIRFDPRLISYGQILQIYFSVAHDPTQLNRQGPDSGTQYRSQIFTTSAEQARIAAAYVSQLDGAKTFARPIATRIAPLRGFFSAEAYHQDYLTRHPTQPYIAINDLPKVAALQQLFPAVYRSDPVLVAGR
ncbi:peptide-methionine (S)-S-oxide reductase MsrA [Labrys sp. KNU-23]|uniref:peptide-methionine (S)-S-oxide reductase MsrA n=1 Tax=Labrys sp. KNU-23 TaxID=2789216 RepID=UPI0011EF7FF7|nr:peptide-methionine (S)-S-oxide reductase MsrA [Labrys sp. KNU-23]QEN91174.1 peptide-methionine (S)-S-oxide reductase MsrA [Labrys sp. KNU-23]